jgi:hypothetical protein
LRQHLKDKNPILILESCLFKLIPGNYSIHGESFDWKISRDFFDHDFSDLENIETDFQNEYESVFSKIQETWGKPDFQGNYHTPNCPAWYWGGIIEISYWIKEEGLAYVVFHRDDKELAYEITLGAITEEAIEEILFE